MSGLALMYEKNSERASQAEFDGFVKRVAEGKRFPKPLGSSAGHGCRAAKYDTRSSLHKNVCADPASGSWLIAAGTVVDTFHPASDGDLGELLRDYIARGAEVLKRLDGVFVLAIYNGRTKTLAVISDPFGFFSVFYGERGQRTYIATSALAVARQVQATPSELGVQCFLRSGKVFGDMTLWREVHRLRPATILEFTPQGPRESTYWTPAMDPSLTKLSLPEAVERAAEVVPSLLRRNLAREGQVWSDLTGGFDTRFMLMLIERAGLDFKANYVGPDNHPDVQIAKAIVQRTGWEHEHLKLPDNWVEEAPGYLEEALYRADGHLNLFLLLRPLWAHHRESEQMQTLLNGLGGEMWRAMNWWSERAAIGRTKDVHYERQLWSLMHPIPEHVMATSSKAWVHDEVTQQLRAAGERFPDAPNTFKMDAVWAWRETSHVGAWSSFAAGLERVLPAMFSKDIVSFVTSLDYRWRVDNSLVKHILFKYRPVLANMLVEGRGPAAPLRVDNFYRFIPSWGALSLKALDKFSQVAFGKTILLKARPTGYSPLAWRQAMLQYAAGRRLLDPSSMVTGNLYEPQALKAFLAEAQTEDFKSEEFLGRVMTVEMAMRETGAAT